MDNGAEGEHELTVESLPTSGVTFKIDDDSEETTYSEDVDSGSYVIEMPESQVVNGSIYIFDRWTDGNLNRIRSVNFNSDTQLTAVFLAAAVAKFSYSPSDPAVGEEITFDASESFDLDGSIQSYAWDFGDGTQQTTTSNPVISHTYYLPNTYPVELTVIDDGSMGSSVTQNVSAKIPTTVSISTSSSSTSIGFQVQISGTLLDDYGMGVADETVVLEYAFEGTSTWTPFTSDQTDANGDYSRVWIPPATGYFTIKAEWAGNATHIGASSTTTINSIEYDGEYVFSVESNSTISALSFNSTENALSFNAQGVTGTQGYAKVIIAKTLVVNPAEILVLLDGNQIQYTLEETLESWIITIRYSHSTHKITVALDTSVIPEFSSVILLSLAISASMVMVAVYRKKLNKK
ncbi:MAG: hypothetical protein CW691_02060 [Candidatus Bathyarchaeum sp.]|nr:MAG: hypothetical protein CW691_02060 [Candidatus Bathyarchaeum sp.]